MNVGIVSNTFDYHDDIRSGKRTLSVRFGQAAALRIIAVTTVVAYLSIVLGALLGILPVWTLLVLITVPLAVNMLQHAGNTATKATIPRPWDALLPCPPLPPSS